LFSKAGTGGLELQWDIRSWLIGGDDLFTLVEIHLTLSLGFPFQSAIPARRSPARGEQALAGGAIPHSTLI
jgi:hypothetical protein